MTDPFARVDRHLVGAINCLDPYACTGATLTASTTTWVPGQSIQLTASANCGYSATATYQFWLQKPGESFQSVRSFSSDPTFTWDTTGLSSGNYNFQVWVKYSGSSQDYDTWAALVETLPPCQSVSMTFTPDFLGGPVHPGTTVSLQASGSCTGLPEYQFWRKPPGGAWTIDRAYSASSSYSWNTTGAQTGDYDFQVWVRTAGSNATTYMEAYTGRGFTLSP